MGGVQAHLESALPEQRHIGMVVGECLINNLNPLDEKHQLKFEYEANDELIALKLLARPISEQEAELMAWREGCGSLSSDLGKAESVKDHSKAEHLTQPEERFGEGLVEATECSDTDRLAKNNMPVSDDQTKDLFFFLSDDNLVPYAMTDDPDSSVPHPPKYLRTLMQGL